jgi:ABC-type transport system involved in multi-copper enzyme maturation permease subunit
MTSMTLLPTAPPTAAPIPIRPLRFSTLTAVELRKMTDTRSSRWLLGMILGLVGFVLAWKVTHASVEVSTDNYGGAVVSVLAFFVPIIGLLAMTSEWTQRTALTTFTLAPRRLHVIAAKFVASMMLSLAVLAVGLLMAVGATALGGLVHGDASYAHLLTDVRGAAIIVALQVTMAAAFGALAAQTAVALVAFLVAPMAWAAVSAELKGASSWFDVFAAYDQLSSNQPFHHLAQSLTAIGVWVVLPSVLGVARSLRREVK